MPKKKFQYDLQPALDKAISEQERCEREIGQLHERLKAEKAKLAELEAKVDQTTQQIATEHDNLARTGASDELTRLTRHVEWLGRRKEIEKEAVREQANQVSFVEVAIEEKQVELTEKIAGVKALEQLKEKARKEFEAIQQKKEEAERDDIAIQLWNRQKRQERS